jgi:hypothetical protein
MLVCHADRERLERAITSTTAAVAPLAGLVLLLVASGCATAPVNATRIATPAPVRTASSSLITTFWCGPPLDEFTDARAAEIAAAGFSVVGPPCEGPITREGNLRSLDVAARHGLTMWLSDTRYNETASLHPGWEALLDASVADYSGHPAFAGYFVSDEPSADKFAQLAPIVSRLRDRDPARVAYINLNPDYVFGGDAARVYREYVDRFVTVVKPSLLSYDYYPFLVDGDRRTFFSSLGLIRDAAETRQLPFLLIILAMPHGKYRDPTDGELSWQAHHALAYGARGISYFAYWTPVHVENASVWRFRRGLLEGGRPTRRYQDAARLNQRLRTLATELESFKTLAVRDSRGEVAPPLPFGPLAGISGSPVTVGFFEDDRGQLMALLVNRDYRHQSTVTVRGTTDEPYERFDPTTRTWSANRSDLVQLPPGGAQMLRWRTSSDAGRTAGERGFDLPRS